MINSSIFRSVLNSTAKHTKGALLLLWCVIVIFYNDAPGQPTINKHCSASSEELLPFPWHLVVVVAIVVIVAVVAVVVLLSLYINTTKF